MLQPLKLLSALPVIFSQVTVSNSDSVCVEVPGSKVLAQQADRVKNND